MINLLPPAYKKQLAASRTNTLLRRYVVFLFVLVFIVLAEIGGVYFFIATERGRNQAAVERNHNKTAEYATVKREATEFKANLTTAKAILDQQVSYTRLIKLIADRLPPNVIIEQLNIDPTTFGTPTTLSIRAKGYNDAIALRNRLNDSAIFSSVSFQSITLQDKDTGSYPYTSTYSVTFKKGIGQQ